MSTQEHIGHGNSVAGWSAVGIMLIGALVCSVAVVNWNMVTAIVGVVIIVLGLASWKVLEKMGYGVKH